jgi:electron transfer flavoprotein beta subunit
MKIVVCIKSVGVIDDEVELLGDGSGVDPDALDHVLNEWDLYAIEEAVQLRDTADGEVIAVSVGGAEIDEVLQRALALGADRALRVTADVEAFDALGTARALHAAIERENADLVLCGVQSSDGGQGGTGSALAALLGLRSAAVVRSVARHGAALIVERELEGGLIAETEVALPALLTIQTGINEPRYVSFRQIKHAEQLTIEVRAVGHVQPGLCSRGVRFPAGTREPEMLEGDAVAVAARVAQIIRDRLA